MTPYLYNYYNSTWTGDVILKEETMLGNREDEKTRIKAIFRDLTNCTLNYRDEDTVTSIEEFFEAQGYLSPKQKELLISIRERSE